jgi:hypothetical protein
MNGNIVVNIEVADDDWVAAQPDPSIFIEYTSANPACAGGDYVDGYFYNPQPFPSWSRNGQGKWIAPVALPEDAGTGEPSKLYIWNESTTSWDEVVIPE